MASGIIIDNKNGYGGIIMDKVFEQLQFFREFTLNNLQKLEKNMLTYNQLVLATHFVGTMPIF